MKRILVVTALLAIVPSFASTERSVTVALSERSFDAQPRNSVSGNSPQFEFQASSWSPSDFRLDSRTVGVSGFHASAPLFSAYFILPSARSRAGDLRFRFGGGLASFSRAGAVRYGSTSREESQSLYLVPVTGGAEFTPALLRSRFASAHVGAALLPTVAMTSPSAHADGQTGVGAGFEISAGGATHLGFADAIIGWKRTFGKVLRGDLAGTGIYGSLRFPL